MNLDEAKKLNCLMQFDEKYDQDAVRVVSIEDPGGNTYKTSRSAELCGGTHVSSTSQVFPFKILSESSVASGTRRIEAVAGASAGQWLQEQVSSVNQIATVLRRKNTSGIVRDVEKLVSQVRELEKQVQTLQLELAKQKCSDPAAHDDHISVHEMDCQVGSKKELQRALQTFANQVLDDQPNKIHIVVSSQSVVCCSKLKDVHAGNLLRNLFENLESKFGKDAGGRGGGQNGFAQGQFTCAPCDTDHILKAAQEITCKK